LNLERALFTAVSQAGTALAPFLSGQDFSYGAPAAIPLPTADKATPVIGTFSTGKGFTGGVTSFFPLPRQAQITTTVGANASS